MKVYVIILRSLLVGGGATPKDVGAQAWCTFIHFLTAPSRNLRAPEAPKSPIKQKMDILDLFLDFGGETICVRPTL